MLMANPYISLSLSLSLCVCLDTPLMAVIDPFSSLSFHLTELHKMKEHKEGLVAILGAYLKPQVIEQAETRTW